MPFTRSLCLAASLLLAATPIAAAPVELGLLGEVTFVGDSIFASGPTEGITVGAEFVDGGVIYDDGTLDNAGGFQSFALLGLSFILPDTTNVGGVLQLVATPGPATRIVFGGGGTTPSDFVGLVLPLTVAGLDDITAFGLTGLALETEGFSGSGFAFVIGETVVEGTLALTPLPAGLALLLPAMASLGLARLARRQG